MKVLSIAAVLAVGSSFAGAQLLEGFEHGNMGLYTQVGGTLDNASIVGAAAHDGQLGARFSDGLGPYFYYRTDVATSAGNSYYGWFRFSANSSGRIYMGVGAGAGGAWSAVAGNNTDEIQLQNNTGYGFSTVASTPFTFTDDTWYSLQVDWAANGDMTVRLFDDARTSQLASTSTFASGATTPGGFSMRGFTNDPGTVVDFDSFSQVPVPEPASMLALGAGIAALVSRRRRQA